MKKLACSLMIFFTASSALSLAEGSPWENPFSLDEGGSVPAGELGVRVL